MTTEEKIRTARELCEANFWDELLQFTQEWHSENPDDAKALFERLLVLRNDLGLLSEEYDPVEKRQLGNFPQAFSHLTLVATASFLEHGPMWQDRRPG